MSGIEKALERIRKAKEEGATELDLSGLGLTEIPSELKELGNYQKCPLRTQTCYKPTKIYESKKKLNKNVSCFILDLKCGSTQNECGSKDWVQQLSKVNENLFGWYRLNPSNQSEIELFRKKQKVKFRRF